MCAASQKVLALISSIWKRFQTSLKFDKRERGEKKERSKPNSDTCHEYVALSCFTSSFELDATVWVEKDACGVVGLWQMENDASVYALIKQIVSKKVFSFEDMD